MPTIHSSQLLYKGFCTLNVTSSQWYSCCPIQKLCYNYQSHITKHLWWRQVLLFPIKGILITQCAQPKWFITKIFFNFLEGCGVNAAYRKPCEAYKLHTQVNTTLEWANPISLACSHNLSLWLQMFSLHHSSSMNTKSRMMTLSAETQL